MNTPVSMSSRAQAPAATTVTVRPRSILISSLWLLLGLGWLALCVYGWGSWVLSEEMFRPVPRGPDVLSATSLMWIRIIEGGSILVTAWMAYTYWFAPWRDGRGFTLEGKLLLGGVFGCFWDPVINLLHWTFAWNTHAFNMGDWSPWVPGHQLGHAFAEGLLWAVPQYLYLGLVTAILMNRGIDAMARRGISFWPAFALVSLGVIAVDFLWEILFIRAELYAYPRSFSWFTLWPGTQFQFPLHEPLLILLYPLAILSLLRSTRGGQVNYLERGFVGLSPRLRLWLGLLAIIGFAGIRPGVWHVPWVFVSHYADSIVTDLPTYMMYDPRPLPH